MQSVESYKGYRITITTTQADSGAWQASAQVVLSDGKTATVQPDRGSNRDIKPFGTEEEARAAALAAAVNAIDRSRVSVGKP